VLEAEAKRLNEAYFKHKATSLPFVTLKIAATLDGKIASPTPGERWITGEMARERVHELRDRNDAVMVGIGTVLSDDPQLTTRLGGGRGRDALRVVVDSAARTPPRAKVIGDAAAPCLIAVSRRADTDRLRALQDAGAQVLMVGDDRVDLQALMMELGGRAIMSVLLEGGSTLAAAAVAAGLVDKFVFFYAPKLFAGRDTPTMLGGDCLPRTQHVGIEAIERVGENFMVVGYPCSPD